jgi:hypothetical protein
MYRLQKSRWVGWVQQYKFLAGLAARPKGPRCTNGCSLNTTQLKEIQSGGFCSLFSSLYIGTREKGCFPLAVGTHGYAVPSPQTGWDNSHPPAIWNIPKQ